MDRLGTKEQAILIVRAMKEPEFLDRLRRDPKSTAREALGIELPAEVSLEILQNSLLVRHIVIPHDDVVAQLRAVEEEEGLDRAEKERICRAMAPAQRAQSDAARPVARRVWSGSPCHRVDCRRTLRSPDSYARG